MNALEKELIAELHRWDDKDYVGVVFVHPEDLVSTMQYVLSLTEGVFKFSNSLVKFNSGAMLMIHDIHESNFNELLGRYAGLELSTILFDQNTFGKYIGGDYVETNFELNYRKAEFLMYLKTRLRCVSTHHPRMVFV